MANLLKSLKDSEELRRMSPRMRLAELNSARQEGEDWKLVYENIRSIVDPMDVMSDTQIFGVEIPWEE